jgi:hypothetical protein
VEKAIADLDELYAGLQTRGRARFNVKVWQTELMRRLRELRRREVAPEWAELRREVAAQFAAARFAAAAEQLKGAEIHGALETEQREALVFLCEEAGCFLLDLQRVLGPGVSGVELRSRSGGEHKQILGSQEGGVLVEDEGAARSLEWGELEPVSLLLLHRKYVEGSEEPAEKERRLRQSAAYAWLNGLEPEAKGIAEELVALKPEFAKAWERIVEVLGE